VTGKVEGRLELKYFSDYLNLPIGVASSAVGDFLTIDINILRKQIAIPFKKTFLKLRTRFLSDTSAFRHQSAKI
jgi:hypothetical protein